LFWGSGGARDWLRPYYRNETSVREHRTYTVACQHLPIRTPITPPEYRLRTPPAARCPFSMVSWVSHDPWVKNKEQWVKNNEQIHTRILVCFCSFLFTHCSFCFTHISPHAPAVVLPHQPDVHPIVYTFLCCFTHFLHINLIVVTPPYFSFGFGGVVPGLPV